MKFLIPRGFLAAGLLSAGLLSAATSYAAITPIAPFTGTHTETWESFDNYTVGPNFADPLPDPTAIMGGFASISATSMFVYQPGSADEGIGENGLAQTSDGAKAMDVNGAGYVTTLTFSAPVSAFGAYWGASDDSTNSDTISLNFSDGSTAVFNHDPSPAGSGALVWRGWSFATPITSLTYTGNYVAIDGLQTTVVPEPASLTLLGLGSIALVVRRRRA